MSRQDDVRVAEILGLEWAKRAHNEPIIPKFTTNAGDDYKVLEWCRKNVGRDTRESYKNELNGLMGSFYDCSHTYFDHANYRPGFYSRALLALKDKGLI